MSGTVTGSFLISKLRQQNYGKTIYTHVNVLLSRLPLRRFAENKCGMLTFVAVSAIAGRYNTTHYFTAICQYKTWKNVR